MINFYHKYKFIFLILAIIAFIFLRNTDYSAVCVVFFLYILTFTVNWFLGDHTAKKRTSKLDI